MNNKYIDLFDILIKSYYDDNFEETLNKIITCHEKSPQETFEIITSLCGVKVDFDNNYVYNLKKAITNYKVNKKIIEKLECSSEGCNPDENNTYGCQRACPFEAIKFDFNNNTTFIDNDICIHCGICIDSCDKGRILDKIEFLPILDLLKNNKTVIAAVDPSIIGQFGSDVSIDQLRAAFVKIGFTDMLETAFASDIISIKQAVEFNKNIKNKNDLMINPCCCPVWEAMLKNDYKNLKNNISPSASPMVVTGRIIKSLNKDAKVVFIGPCIAKKIEAKEKDVEDAIDFVLTFEEVNNIFEALDINPIKLKGIPSIEYTSKGGRLYALSGGCANAVKETLKEIYEDNAKTFISKSAQGIEECKTLLNEASKNNINANFIEGMACKCGCVGGPKILVPPKDGKEAVEKFAYDASIKVAVHNKILDDVLDKFKINSLDDFNDSKKIKFLNR